MGRSSRAIVEDINHIDPLSGDWDAISTLVEQLMCSEEPAQGADALLGVFERGAGIESGGGVFSDILHALEHIPGYEDHLVKSLRRRPAVFSVRMVDRLLNSGILRVASTPLPALLVELANNPDTLRIVRDEIRSVLARHTPAMLNRLKDL